MIITKYRHSKTGLNFRLSNFISCLGFLLLFVNLSIAQNKEYKVSGVVIDAKGISMPGVNILLKGATKSTVTDMDGKYTISVPNEQAILVL